ncbi:hypothetical protein [Nocardia nova]|uniref:hypothetical protein n=1 Tax=Nocardia nova TaxID=37330 RepID=UPI002739187A|nr:hypothetical protein [Nocardia nova]
MKNNIPAPHNPAITALLKSPQMRSLVAERAEAARAIYQQIVAKRTGRLASSARVDTFIGGRHNDRWIGRLTVEAPYAASHEYGTKGGVQTHSGAHDLNAVLNQLGTL